MAQVRAARGVARTRWWLGALLAAVTLTSAGCGGVASGPPRRVTAIVGRDWGPANADDANTRRVTGPIDAASVHRLRLAWTVPLPTMPGAYTATSPIVDGVVYTQDMRSNVAAIDVRGGHVLWRKRYESVDNGPNGVTFGNGRVFGATPTNAFALDAATGHELWNVRLNLNPVETIDMAPGYHWGTVYVSTVPALGVASKLWALDAATGRRK